jgi:hypothetical protein
MHEHAKELKLLYRGTQQGGSTNASTIQKQKSPGYCKYRGVPFADLSKCSLTEIRI